MKAHLKVLYYKLSFIVLSLLLSCCTTNCATVVQRRQVERPASTMGTTILCNGTRPRKVQCASGIEDHNCRMLEEAVSYINDATGTSMFVYVGRIKEEKNWHPTLDNLMVHYGKKDKGDEMAVMKTSLWPEKESGCIKYEHIAVLMPMDSSMSDASIQTFFRHELGHALGLAHEDEGFDGLMRRAFEMDRVEPVDFTLRELNLIKAMYPFAHPPALEPRRR